MILLKREPAEVSTTSGGLSVVTPSSGSLSGSPASENVSMQQLCGYASAEGFFLRQNSEPKACGTFPTLVHLAEGGRARAANVVGSGVPARCGGKGAS